MSNIILRNRGRNKRAETPAPIQTTLNVIGHVLEDYGLDRDADGFFGQLRGYNNFFWQAKVSMDVDVRGEEVFLQPTIRLSWQTAAILIAIFLFPVGLILPLVLQDQAKQEAERVLEDCFEDITFELKKPPQ